MKSNRIFGLIAFAILTGLLSWYVYVNYEPVRPPMPAISDAEAARHIPHLRFKELPRFTTQQKKLAAFGKQLFFDPGFSANEKISCATCHIPERSFTDGKPVATALGVAVRNTPTLINQFANYWFFWDGRSDSLASQALGPIENMSEHGISRVAVARLLASNYRKTYEEFFGAWPEVLTKEVLQQDALPLPAVLTMPAANAAYAVASLKDFLSQAKFMSGGNSPAAKFSEFAMQRAVYPPAWVSRWDELGLPVQSAVDRVAANFGLAIAAYEETLFAVDSPFDRFAARVDDGQTPAAALQRDEFDSDALQGLKLFLGKAQCILCHNGPAFTDNQFHNTGLPKLNDDAVDVGRARGVIEAVHDRFNCRGGILPLTESESCRELEFLDDQNTELVGAFKTPTLRNLKDTAPYMHDGRFTTLSEVVDFYNDLPGEPVIGHREESLRPLFLNANEKRALTAFLESLHSKIE
jgi:cytochrome c peroxidase